MNLFIKEFQEMELIFMIKWNLFKIMEYIFPMKSGYLKHLEIFYKVVYKLKKNKE